jgi:hypothetical protein
MKMETVYSSGTLPTKLHGITSQKTTISNFTSVKTCSIKSRSSYQLDQNDETVLREYIKL